MSSTPRLYDTLSGEINDLQPAGTTVNIYVCGITPYDAMHLGHAFTFVSFDVLIRYLRYLGHEVRYVQNITDIDDPLFVKASQLGIGYQELAARETEQYLADTEALNILPAEVYPRASGEIPEMIALVQRLLEAGHAYQRAGSVYFSINSDPDYGILSKYGRDRMIVLARARGGDPDDPHRRDPLDFVLWRPSQPGEPVMPSPWGEGLPGWHLECSAMSLKYLGAPLDIHGGGSDLIFPHHENEIAQSESATGIRPLARHWMHTGMVFMDGEKMSKSLGNMVFARDLAPKYGADAVRLYLSGCHYRSELHWDAAALKRTQGLARNLAEAASLPAQESHPALDAALYRDRFMQRMNDDLDTPGAITVLGDLADTIRQDSARGNEVTQAQSMLRELSGVLGLRLDRTHAVT
ncbi:MAG: cysteine--tRNA ligase [Chloroflexota bacterium]|nr:cysteine--tRNA ligase [Chloroflexota bacterium]